MFGPIDQAIGGRKGWSGHRVTMLFHLVWIGICGWGRAGTALSPSLRAIQVARVLGFRHRCHRRTWAFITSILRFGDLVFRRPSAPKCRLRRDDTRKPSPLVHHGGSFSPPPRPVHRSSFFGYDGGKKPPRELFHDAGDNIPTNGSLVGGKHGTLYTRTWHGGEFPREYVLALPKKTFRRLQARFAFVAASGFSSPRVD